MPVRPDHVDPIVLERARSLPRITALAREVHRDGLARHRDAVLHPGRSDRLFANVEVSLEDLDQLGVRHPGLLDPEVEVFALALRFVQRQFVDDEVLVAELDAAGEDRSIEHATTRHRIAETPGFPLRCDVSSVVSIRVSCPVIAHANPESSSSSTSSDPPGSSSSRPSGSSEASSRT